MHFHTVVIKFEPSVGTETKATLANVDQKRVKKQEIHQKTMDKFLAAIKPSWANSEVASALHYREFSMSLLDEPSAVAGRLVESLVAECGVKVDAALGTTYSGRKLRGAPKMTKLAVVGPGASTACRSLSEKYGCVHGMFFTVHSVRGVEV